MKDGVSGSMAIMRTSPPDGPPVVHTSSPARVTAGNVTATHDVQITAQMLAPITLTSWLRGAAHVKRCKERSAPSAIPVWTLQ
jgi:hypothetical protein